MISKNIFSAVLVSIFVLSVFSFLSGNALAEETCGNGVCDIGEETTYNCPADCLLPGDDFHEDYTINTSQPAIINTFDGTEYEIKVEYNGCGPNGNINLIIDGKRYENLVLGSRAWVNNWTSVEITGIPCAVDQIALRFWETSEEEPTCTDSDGGKNYYEKGILSGTAVGKTDIIESCYLLNSDGSGSPVDSCDSSDPRCKIYEHWCENGEVLAQGYHCPNGCKDGACIKEKPTCTDSDGGKDYYENGKIIYDNGKSEAYDWCVNDKTLKESYCVNGKYNYEYYNCPYGCIVGKCLKSYETGKKYHLDLEKKKIFEITFNGVDYTIDTTQLSCFYSTAHKLIISYDDKTFISDRIGPYEKFNLENGDYLINSGCPTGAPVINLAFIGKKRTTTT
ncbi:MAG: hypothetical protein J7L08_02245, partial [Candidatus Aenigmarchaeota archaeon]|nr:hypothetical protein [Candidatus Aenigmarchaeota archaeon]